MTNLEFFKGRVEATIPTRKFMRDRKADPDKMILVDVRNPHVSQEDMSTKIEGAIHMPQRELIDRLSELPKDKLIIAYTWDDWCNLAAHAAIALLENGYQAMELRGGIAAWKSLGYPTEPLDVK